MLGVLFVAALEIALPVVTALFLTEVGARAARQGGAAAQHPGDRLRASRRCIAFALLAAPRSCCCRGRPSRSSARASAPRSDLRGLTMGKREGKTEKPTEKKKQDAQEEGHDRQVAGPRSVDDDARRDVRDARPRSAARRRSSSASLQSTARGVRAIRSARRPCNPRRRAATGPHGDDAVPAHRARWRRRRRPLRADRSGAVAPPPEARLQADQPDPRAEEPVLDEVAVGDRRSRWPRASSSAWLCWPHVQAISEQLAERRTGAVCSTGSRRTAQELMGMVRVVVLGRARDRRWSTTSCSVARR